jgi:glyceraldehyde 3-phosphate dehydrogenase
VAKAIPELAGKLTGNAIRVTTPNVSMAILNLQLSRSVAKDELNEFLRFMALHS